MDIYVANCTDQVQIFNYRPMGSIQLQYKSIPIGQQTRIGSPMWGTPELDHIIDQHRVYGMIHVSEVDRTRHFAGLCYDIDKPVPIAKVKYTVETNQAVLVAQGEQNRADAAVVVNNQVETSMKAAGAEVTATHIEIVENEPSREARSRGATDPQLAETITIDRRAEAPHERSGRAPSKARGRPPAAKPRAGKRTG